MLGKGDQSIGVGGVPKADNYYGDMHAIYDPCEGLRVAAAQKLLAVPCLNIESPSADRSYFSVSRGEQK